MVELLIEIYSEEIPARMQQKAADDFKKIFSEFLNKQSIHFLEENLKTFVTPRRLVLFLGAINEKQIGQSVDKMGPKIDAPTQAIQGFLKSVGVDDISLLKKIVRENGEYYFYQQPVITNNVADILEKNLNSLLGKMSGTWIKSMDLIDLNKQSRWVRPIRSILAIFAGRVLNFEFANLKAGNQTFGHLLMGKEPLQIVDFSDYKKQLENNFVVLDWFKRREIIAGEIKKIDPNLLEDNSKLIDEITGLVEYPQVLVGNIDDQFVNLPKDVLQLTIQMHQKAVLFYKEKSAYFIFVSNAKVDESSTKKIIADNEKVVKARLFDAKFYIEEDLKIPFKSRTELLKNIIFHKKLGSVYCKVQRLEALCKLVSVWIPLAKLSEVKSLALLAKNDLTTKTVAELTELQGVVGGYYAKVQGESSDIYQAIAEQYLPVGQNSDLPQTPLGIALAISDKVDTICSLFIADEKPSSSKDPFALRRAALGIVKILYTKEVSLPLKIIIEKAINIYPTKDFKALYPTKSNSEIKKLKQELSLEIIQFFIERNKAYLKEYHLVKPEIVNQAFEDLAKKSIDYNPFSISKKAIFVNNFMNDIANSKIIDLYKRASNIVTIEEKKDKTEYNEKVSRIFLKTEYDKLLYKKTKFVLVEVQKSLKNNDYNQALLSLVALELPITHFFDNVEINCNNTNLRANRLHLLSKVKNLFQIVLG